MARPLSTLSLSLSLAALAPGAQAQVSITTGASGLRYTLSDLKPADAAAPAVRFGGSTASQFLQASLHAYHGQPDPVDDYQVNLLDDGADATRVENRWGDGASSLATFSLGAGMQDWRGSAGAYAPRILNEHFDIFARNRSPVQAFQLAPHTGMTVYVDIGMDMSSGRDPWSSQYGFGIGTLYGVLGSMPQLMDSVAEGVGAGLPGLDSTLTRTLSLSFSNDSDAWLDGSFGWTIDSTARIYVTVAVPEPGAWAMYLAGAALLAGAARRAGRRPAAAAIR